MVVVVVWCGGGGGGGVWSIRQAAAELVVGDPLAAGTQMGPLVSLPQMEKVNEAVHHAELQGATVLAPELALDEGLKGGYYVP